MCSRLILGRDKRVSRMLDWSFGRSALRTKRLEVQNVRKEGL